MSKKRVVIKSKQPPVPAWRKNSKWIAIGAVAFIVVVVVLVVLSSNAQNQADLGSATATGVVEQTGQVNANATDAARYKVTPMKWSSAPPMTIDKTKQYTATVTMAKGGSFVIQLYPDKAPITVNSFVFLARQGYFTGITFHRVLEGFMAQTGDPTGTGGGGPGYQFVNENSDLKFDEAGVVAMANAGPNTNGSQFFITFGPQPSLNGGYTIFGQVVSGMNVVNAITRRDPQTNPSYTGDVIASITITEK